MNIRIEFGAERGAIAVKLLIALVIFALLGAGYLYGVLKWSYSTGERAGWIQKHSLKGWFCKTWEGEISMISMPGVAPEKFFFTVWDESVAADINKLMGRRVTLHYEEKVGIPTSCFGETRYIVTRVTGLDSPGAPQSPAPQSAVPPAGTAAGSTSAGTPNSTPAATAAPPSAGENAAPAAPEGNAGGTGLRFGPSGASGSGLSGGAGGGLMLKPGS